MEALFDALQDRVLTGLMIVGGPAAVSIGAELESGRPLSEVVRRRIEGDRYRMAEEGLIDHGERFILGPIVPFDQSFVPVIAEMLEDHGTPQLVLIFKPISELEGEPDEDARAFTRDAVAYFERKGIESINFLEEDRIRLDHYASGDHYNESGRQLLTRLIAEALARMEHNATGKDGEPPRIASRLSSQATP